MYIYLDMYIYMYVYIYVYVYYVRPHVELIPDSLTL